MAAEAVQESQKRRIRDMKDSLSSHHTEMRAAVDESFAKINAATELYSKVDGSVLRSDEVTRLVLGYTKVGEQGADIVKAFAEEELGRLALLMESLGNGTADCPGENHEWLIDLTKCVKRTLYATSTSVDRDFWSSEPARRYLAAQETAIKSRRVEIRRVFLVDEESEVTGSLRQLCERHRKFGIDARIAVRALLEPTAQMNSLNDFIIFDGELSYETEPDIRVMPAKTTLKMTHEHVEERINRFNVLWEATEPDRAPEPSPNRTREGRSATRPDHANSPDRGGRSHGIGVDPGRTSPDRCPRPPSAHRTLSAVRAWFRLLLTPTDPFPPTPVGRLLIVSGTVLAPAGCVLPSRRPLPGLGLLSAPNRPVGSGLHQAGRTMTGVGACSCGGARKVASDFGIPSNRLDGLIRELRKACSNSVDISSGLPAVNPWPTPTPVPRTALVAAPGRQTPAECRGGREPRRGEA